MRSICLFSLINKKRETLKQFATFCFFGGVRTFISLIIFTLLLKMHFSQNQSIYLVWAIAFFFTFFTNLKFVFHTNSSVLNFIIFTVYSIGYVVLLSFITTILNNAINMSLIAYLCSIIFLLPLNFLISKKIMLNKN